MLYSEYIDHASLISLSSMQHKILNSEYIDHASLVSQYNTRLQSILLRETHARG